MNILKNIVREIGCDKVILHDIFNATSITHHDIGKYAIKAAKSNKGLGSLALEGTKLKNYLEEISTITDEVVIVKSNHDEALDRYLNEGRFINDPENFYFSLDLVKKLIEGKDPLKHMITDTLGLKSKSKVSWLERDEDYLVYGIECGSHGDLGANGAKSSMNTLEKGYNKCVVGHSHTAGIYRQVYQVGTSSGLKLDYNKGLSSWTHTMCLIYSNSCRQLINIIKNKFGEYSYRI